MPYDGSQWDESNPTNSTLANEIDDIARDMKIGARSRMAIEHIWPSSQTGTSEAGYHTYISFLAQTGNPTVPVVASVTQAGVLFVTAGNLTFRNSAGSNATIISSGATALNLTGGVYSATGTLGEMVIGTTGGTLRILSPGTSGTVLTATTGGAGVAWTSNAGIFAGVVDYGTSLTTGTTVPDTSLYCYYGRATLSSGVATISGLPFSNATSYAISVTRVSTLHTEAVFATSVGASSFVINGNLSNSDIVSWKAIGR